MTCPTFPFFTRLGLVAATVLTTWVGTLQAEEAATGGVTTITSEKLTFDQGKQIAIFEEDVLVNDESMKLRTDLLTVRFSESGEAERVEARGSVYIVQENKQAWAGEADYDLASGLVELRVSPRVRQGKDMLSGEIIRFYRDENKMVCEPRARLVLYPGTGNDDFGLRIEE